MPMTPEFPESNPVLDAFVSQQNASRVYVLAPRNHAALILQAANIESQLTFIPETHWQEGQPWSEQKFEVRSSNTRQGMYCTPISAKIGLFYVTCVSL